MIRGLAPLVLLAGAAGIALGADPAPRSGLDYATPGIQSMQRDDFANPGMLWVAQGQSLWDQPEGAAGKSCASCHGDIANMAAVVFPKRGPGGKLVNLETQIGQCRAERMRVVPFEYESKELLSLATAIRHQARGKPVEIGEDRAALDEGERYFRQRQGRLDLSCAQCHDQNAGKKLRDEVISQGQSNGFPTYRLRWREVGSLHRRFQVCNQAVGAEPYDLGSQEYIALEWYLAWRGRGLPVETPAVRQ